MWEKLPDGKCGVYLTLGNRPASMTPEGCPEDMFKIGHSSYVNPMDRLGYLGPDEPSPLIKLFPNMDVKMFVICNSKDEAFQLEQYVISKIQGNEKWFKNWQEPPRWPGDKPSGIRELRRYNRLEIRKAIELLYEQAKLYGYKIIFY